MNNYKQRFRKFYKHITDFNNSIEGKPTYDGYIYVTAHSAFEHFISQELNLLLDRVEKEIGEDEYEEEEFIEGKNMLRDELRQKIEEIRKEI